MSRRSSVARPWSLLSLAPLLGTLVLGACSGLDSLRDLETHAPPPEHGRPGWVRACAKAGAIVGAVPGVIFTVVALPITYPLTLLADEPLGNTDQELIFAPLTVCASAGHFLLGAPADSVHWVFYRAWTDKPSPAGYDFTPMAPPIGPAGAPEVPVTRPATQPIKQPSTQTSTQPATQTSRK